MRNKGGTLLPKKFDQAFLVGDQGVDLGGFAVRKVAMMDCSSVGGMALARPNYFG